MKNLLLIIVVAIGVSSVAFGQTKMSKDSKVEAQIIALEKAGWVAWKNKDSAFYQTNLAEDALNVNSEGVSNKSQIIKSLADCEIKSFSLDNFKFLMLDKNSALITFTGMQDGVCSGKTIPATVRASSVYVKRGGKWLNALYTEISAQGTTVSVNQSGGSAEQAIRQTMTELFSALNRGDADAAGRIYTDDYQIVMENGKTVTKAERLEAMRSGALKFQSVAFDNLRIRQYGNAAVATFQNTGKSNALGSEQEVNSVGTVTLINNGGRWQVASAHLTKPSAN